MRPRSLQVEQKSRAIGLLWQVMAVDLRRRRRLISNAPAKKMMIKTRKRNSQAAGGPKSERTSAVRAHICSHGGQRAASGGCGSGGDGGGSGSGRDLGRRCETLRPRKKSEPNGGVLRNERRRKNHAANSRTSPIAAISCLGERRRPVGQSRQPRARESD